MAPIQTAVENYDYKPPDEITWASFSAVVGTFAGALAAVLGADALLVAPITGLVAGGFRLIVVPPLAWFLKRFSV
jgi:hypothetical protein